jgi:hypothetical protein
MNTSPGASSLRRTNASPYPILFACAVVAAGLLLAIASDLLVQPPQHVIAPESRIARCARLAGVAIDELAAKGIDVQTPRLQRHRDLAVQACANDFANFDWLLSGK